MSRIYYNAYLNMGVLPEPVYCPKCKFYIREDMEPEDIPELEVHRYYIPSGELIYKDTHLVCCECGKSIEEEKPAYIGYYVVGQIGVRYVSGIDGQYRQTYRTDGACKCFPQTPLPDVYEAKTGAYCEECFAKELKFHPDIGFGHFPLIDCLSTVQMASIETGKKISDYYEED